MSKKSYAILPIVEHGGATTMTLGAGGINSEGGSWLVEP
jgi:hypothetical protein